MEIKQLSGEDIPAALALIREVFSECVAKYYTERAAKKFLSFHSDPENFDDAAFYGAFDDKGDLAGVIAARNELSHIAAFYVSGKYRGQGLGKKLFERLSADSENAYVTVNASPYAIGIYEKLGFIQAGETQDNDGAVYTPMMCVFRR